MSARTAVMTGVVRTMTPEEQRVAWLALPNGGQKMLAHASLEGGASPWDYSSHCVGRMKRLGLVALVKVVTRSLRPSLQPEHTHTVYAITDAGRQVLAGRNSHVPEALLKEQTR